MPDDALLELAAKGKLGTPDTLHAQVERMLDDPRAHAFTENFTGQWLKLRDVFATTPEMSLYRDYDDLLGQSMVRETHLFFEEMLKGDRSLLEFVHCDWSILNERLARHYGIAGVKGHSFRKVDLPADSHRGGVLTQASVLKVTANGTGDLAGACGRFCVGPHPWHAPAAAPQDVEAIEPDIRGATTIRHNSPSTGRMRPAPPATPRSTRRVLPWKVSTSSAVGAIAIAFTPVIRPAWGRSPANQRWTPGRLRRRVGR